MLETVTRTLTIDAPAVAPHCVDCGALASPNGTCLEIGACPAADRAATRGAVRETSKYGAAPAAWNSRGGVD